MYNTLHFPTVMEKRETVQPKLPTKHEGTPLTLSDKSLRSSTRPLRSPEAWRWLTAESPLDAVTAMARVATMAPPPGASAAALQWSATAAPYSGATVAPRHDEDTTL